MRRRMTIIPADDAVRVGWAVTPVTSVLCRRSCWAARGCRHRRFGRRHRRVSPLLREDATR